MSISDVISVVALLISLVSAVAAVISARAANMANRVALTTAEVNKQIFKRQGVIELHMAWRDVKQLDAANIDATDAIRAANALDLTAALWNHDVVEHVILYQSYWTSYRNIYDTLYNFTAVLPNTNTT